MKDTEIIAGPIHSYANHSPSLFHAHTLFIFFLLRSEGLLFVYDYLSIITASLGEANLYCSIALSHLLHPHHLTIV
jgi:hypothetical protein